MKRQVQQKIPMVKEMLKRHGVVEAYLFGSMAKSSPIKRSSDVDILVHFDPKLDYIKYADHYFALLAELRTLLKRDIDLVAAETITNPYLAQSIEQSKIRIL